MPSGEIVRRLLFQNYLICVDTPYWRHEEKKEAIKSENQLLWLMSEKEKFEDIWKGINYEVFFPFFIQISNFHAMK